jgi:hypothetical protein
MSGIKRVPDVVVVAGAVIAGIIVIWAGNHFGWWWVTALVGAALGVGLRGTWRVLGAAALAALAGWGLDLALQSFGGNIGEVASTVSGIMGFGTKSGYLVVLLALIFALLLGLAGAWAGAALRRGILLVAPGRISG